jgi:hypothetical protein
MCPTDPPPDHDPRCSRDSCPSGGTGDGLLRSRGRSPSGARRCLPSWTPVALRGRSSEQATRWGSARAAGGYDSRVDPRPIRVVGAATTGANGHGQGWTTELLAGFDHVKSIVEHHVSHLFVLEGSLQAVRHLMCARTHPVVATSTLRYHQDCAGQDGEKRCRHEGQPSSGEAAVPAGASRRRSPSPLTTAIPSPLVCSPRRRSLPPRSPRSGCGLPLRVRARASARPRSTRSQS